VTVHNPQETQAVRPSFYTLLFDWPFPWASHMLRQAQLCALSASAVISDDVPEQRTPITYNGRGYARHNRLLTDLRRFGIPVVNEEPGYEMEGLTADLQRVDPRPFNTQTTESMIPTMWSATCAGAYVMWGHLGTYVTGDPLPDLRKSETPRALRALHDCLTALPFWEMAPANELVAGAEREIEGERFRTTFCLAREDRAYLVYALHGGGTTLRLGTGRYALVRIDPRTGERAALGEVDGGERSVALPEGGQVLVATRLGGS
jgi:hypothetical protein